MSASFSATRLTLRGTGDALPGPRVDNDELLAALEKHCDGSAAALAARLADRLGIRSRHLSRDLGKSRSGTLDGRDAPSLCRTALAQALEEAAMPVSSVDYLLGHTVTPHTLLPSNIAWVAEAMDYPGPYAELRQACTGFANALDLAASKIGADGLQAVAIVGSETGSPFFDISPGFADREQLINYVQMGDGAGATVVGPDDGAERQLISDIFVGQVGLGLEPGISIVGGGSSAPASAAGLPAFRHRARDVRRNGETLFLEGIRSIESRGYRIDEFDWIVPHQANGRIASMFESRLGIPARKVFVVADRLGNLGSAAIWVAFNRLRRSGELQRGQRVLVLGAEASKYLYGGFVYLH